MSIGKNADETAVKTKVVSRIAVGALVLTVLATGLYTASNLIKNPGFFGFAGFNISERLDVVQVKPAITTITPGYNKDIAKFTVSSYYRNWVYLNEVIFTPIATSRDLPNLKKSITDIVLYADVACEQNYGYSNQICTREIGRADGYTTTADGKTYVKIRIKNFVIPAQSNVKFTLRANVINPVRDGMKIAFNINGGKDIIGSREARGSDCGLSTDQYGYAYDDQDRFCLLPLKTNVINRVNYSLIIKRISCSDRYGYNYTNDRYICPSR